MTFLGSRSYLSDKNVILSSHGNTVKRRKVGAGLYGCKDGCGLREPISADAAAKKSANGCEEGEGGWFLPSLYSHVASPLMQPPNKILKVYRGGIATNG